MTSKTLVEARLFPELKDDYPDDDGPSHDGRDHYGSCNERSDANMVMVPRCTMMVGGMC